MQMSEKEMFIQTWEREFQTTLKLLKEYPAHKLELKPAEKSRSAKDLAWTFVLEENALVGGAIKGNIDFQNMPKPPGTLQEIISKYEQSHQENVQKVKNLPDDEFNKTMKFFTGPKQMGDVRKGDVFWTGVMDTVHHRGQFSVYLRMAGAKVPSIYGPSADEPWM
ncbi:MAG: hypothetical protein HY707_10885 [Ignavibacteriae bacterium]|nr:hypothetical protein [Ignavibacteriota bacterium]